jgi:hypothetical protein
VGDASPLDCTGWPNNGTKEGAQQYFDWFKLQFWRFVFVQQVMGKALQSFLALFYAPRSRGQAFFSRRLDDGVTIRTTKINVRCAGFGRNGCAWLPRPRRSRAFTSPRLAFALSPT